MSKPIRVVVIDSHPIFRQGVIRTIGRSDGLALWVKGRRLQMLDAWWTRSIPTF